VCESESESESDGEGERAEKESTTHCSRRVGLPPP
jgi:hypothetical protein